MLRTSWSIMMLISNSYQMDPTWQWAAVHGWLYYIAQWLPLRAHWWRLSGNPATWLGLGRGLRNRVHPHGKSRPQVLNTSNTVKQVSGTTFADLWRCPPPPCGQQLVREGLPDALTLQALPCSVTWMQLFHGPGRWFFFFDDFLKESISFTKNAHCNDCSRDYFPFLEGHYEWSSNVKPHLYVNLLWKILHEILTPWNLHVYFHNFLRVILILEEQANFEKKYTRAEF